MFGRFMDAKLQKVFYDGKWGEPWGVFFVLEEVEVSEYLFYVYDFGARVPCDASGCEIPF